MTVYKVCSDVGNGDIVSAVICNQWQQYYRVGGVTKVVHTSIAFDDLNAAKRWTIGYSDVVFSAHCKRSIPITSLCGITDTAHFSLFQEYTLIGKDLCESPYLHYNCVPAPDHTVFCVDLEIVEEVYRKEA